MMDDIPRYSDKEVWEYTVNYTVGLIVVILIIWAVTKWLL